MHSSAKINTLWITQMQTKANTTHKFIQIIKYGIKKFIQSRRHGISSWAFRCPSSMLNGRSTQTNQQFINAWAHSVVHISQQSKLTMAVKNSWVFRKFDQLQYTRSKMKTPQLTKMAILQHLEFDEDWGNTGIQATDAKSWLILSWRSLWTWYRPGCMCLEILLVHLFRSRFLK